MRADEAHLTHLGHLASRVARGCGDARPDVGVRGRRRRRAGTPRGHRGRGRDRARRTGRRAVRRGPREQPGRRALLHRVGGAQPAGRPHRHRRALCERLRRRPGVRAGLPGRAGTLRGVEGDPALPAGQLGDRPGRGQRPRLRHGGRSPRPDDRTGGRRQPVRHRHLHRGDGGDGHRLPGLPRGPHPLHQQAAPPERHPAAHLLPRLHRRHQRQPLDQRRPPGRRRPRRPRGGRLDGRRVVQRGAEGAGGGTVPGRDELTAPTRGTACRRRRCRSSRRRSCSR
ncbi:putative Alcohol dehydrogenase [Streptomyces misionensis JCM 4497]